MSVQRDDSWILHLMMVSGVAAIGIGVIFLVLSIVPLGERGIVVTEFIISPEIAFLVLCGMEVVLWSLRRYRMELITEQGFVLATHVIQLLGYLSLWQYLMNVDSFAFLELLGLSKLFIGSSLFIVYVLLNILHQRLLPNKYWHDLILLVFSYLTVVILADPNILQGQVVVIVLLWMLVTIGNIVVWSWSARSWISHGQIFLSALLLFSSSLTPYMAFLLPVNMLYAVSLLFFGLNEHEMWKRIIPRDPFKTRRQYLVAIALLGTFSLPLVRGLNERLFPLMEAVIIILLFVVFLMALTLRSSWFSSPIGLLGFIVTYSLPFIVSAGFFSRTFVFESSIGSFGLFLVLLFHTWRHHEDHGDSSSSLLTVWGIVGWFFLYIGMHLHVRFVLPVLSILFIFGALLLVLSFIIKGSSSTMSILHYIFPSSAWMIQMITIIPSVESLLLHHSMFLIYLVILLSFRFIAKHVLLRNDLSSNRFFLEIPRWQDVNVILLGLSLLLSLLFIPPTWLYPLVSSQVALMILFAFRMIKRSGFGVIGGHLGLLQFFFISSLSSSFAGVHLSDEIRMLGFVLGLGFVLLDHGLSRRRMVVTSQINSGLPSREFFRFSRISLSEVHVIGLFVSLVVFFTVSVHWITYVLVFVGIPFTWLISQFFGRRSLTSDEIRLFTALMGFSFPFFHYYQQYLGKTREILPETVLLVIFVSWIFSLLMTVDFREISSKSLKHIRLTNGLFVTSIYLLVIFLLTVLESLILENVLILSVIMVMVVLLTGMIDVMMPDLQVEYFLVHLSFILVMVGLLTLFTNPNSESGILVMIFIIQIFLGVLVVIKVFGRTLSAAWSSKTGSTGFIIPSVYVLITVLVPPSFSLIFPIDLMISAMSYVMAALLLALLMVAVEKHADKVSTPRMTTLVFLLNGSMLTGGAVIILLVRELRILPHVFSISWSDVDQIVVSLMMFIVLMVLSMELIRKPSLISSVLTFLVVSALGTFTLILVFSSAWRLMFRDDTFLVALFVIPLILLLLLTILSFLWRSLHARTEVIDGMLAGFVLVLLMSLLFHVQEPLYALMTAISLVLTYLVVQARWQQSHFVVTASSVLFMHLIVSAGLLVIQLWNSMLNNAFPFELAVALLLWGFVILVLGNNMGKFFMDWKKRMTEPSQEAISVDTFANANEKRVDRQGQLEMEQEQPELSMIRAEAYQCPNCLRPLRMKGRFCIYCGHRLE